MSGIEKEAGDAFAAAGSDFLVNRNLFKYEELVQILLISFQALAATCV